MMEVSIDAVIFDLDGTVYHDDQPVEGAPELIRRLKDDGFPHLFATNRANRTPETIARMLRGYGLECSADDVVTASTATASYLEPKGTVFIIGEDALRQALVGAGFVEVNYDPDYVVVGLDRGLTYAKLNIAARSIRHGAQFVATNPDLLVNANDGEKDIGNGVIVGALALATGQQPLVIGKPHAPLFDAALERLRSNSGLDLSPDRVLAVGDNIKTDIEGGIRGGFKTALIFTGISEPADVDGMEVKPDYQIDGYEDLTKILYSMSTNQPQEDE